VACGRNQKAFETQRRKGREGEKALVAIFSNVEISKFWSPKIYAECDEV